MKKVMIFGMFIGMMIATPIDASFFRRRKVNGHEEKIIKEYLEIKEEGDKIIIRSGPPPTILIPGRYHTFLTSEFKEILNKEMGPEEAPRLTYGIYVLNAIYETKTMEYVLSQNYKAASTTFFDNFISGSTDWSSFMTKKVLSAPSTAAGSLFMALDLGNLGALIGVNYRTYLFNTLGSYFEWRKGSSHGEAWENATSGDPWTANYFKNNKKIETAFIRLWETYGEGGLLTDNPPPYLKQDVIKERLKTLLIEALESLEKTRLPTLPPPTWEEIPVDGLVTALVVDRSESMTGKKINRAKEAAYVYVDTSLEQKDMFSLAAFSDNAESITEPISIAEGREILKKDILSLSAGGSTNVGSGLTIALAHLSSCNPRDKRAVLMSDGRHNTGTYQPEVAEFQNRGWPIDTVAFGRDADQEMLSQIACQTGGSFYPAETSDISSIYHKLNVLAHQGSVFRSYNDFIRTGEKLAYDILVEPDMKKVGFFTNWQGSRMETILFSPNKTVISRSNISQYGKFVEGQTHNCFEINNPQVGPWQALITGYELPPKGEQINFHSFCQSDVSSNFLGFQPRYSKNQEVRIGVRLAEVINSRLSPLPGAQVTAEIKKPSTSLNKLFDIRKKLEPAALLGIFQEISGQAQKITLFDDGLHQDFLAGDGIYANTYNQTTLNGPYLVTIDCQGSTSQGLPLKRTLQESFQVGPIEQNSFTVSNFLNLLTQGSSGNQVPSIIPSVFPEKGREQPTQELLETLFNKLLKK